MAGVNNTVKKLKERSVSLAPLLEILQCAVCLEVVKIPFKECIRGHLICIECIQQLPNCPTCRGAFSLQNPVCMKNLIESLPKVCRYTEKGCKEVVEPNDNHEIYCKFRPVLCRICVKETPLHQFQEHWKQNHAERPLHTNRSSNFILEKFKIVSNYNCFVFFHGNYFWLIVKCSNETVDIKWQANFVAEPTHDYFIKLKFESENVGFTQTLKVLDVSSVGDNAEDDGISSTKLFFNTLKRYINDEGNLEFYYVIFRKPKVFRIKDVN